MTIVSRGFRCTTFRDGDPNQGPFAVMRCDGCGTEDLMRRKNERTLTSPDGWVDDGPHDKCPRCSDRAALGSDAPEGGGHTNNSKETSR